MPGLASADEAAAQSLTQNDLLRFDPMGQVTLLHVTDVHAQLMSIYVREPSVTVRPNTTG